jgi:hypothetical protein
MSDDAKPAATPESSYPPLRPPGEFKSQIPEHLMVDASPQDRHIMDALSIGSQYDRWLVDALVATHSQVRTTNGRLIRAESEISDLKADRKTVLTGWKLLTAIAVGLAGVISFLITVYKALHGASD